MVSAMSVSSLPPMEDPQSEARAGLGLRQTTGFVLGPLLLLLTLIVCVIYLRLIIRRQALDR